MASFPWNGGNGTRLAELCDEIAHSKRLIVASNRGPVEYRVSQDGKLLATWGGGGLAIALSALSRYVDFTWVACAMCEGDRYAAEGANHGTLVASLDHQRFFLRFVVIPESTYEKYYSIFCNPFLWFLQHNMWSPSYDPDIGQQVWDA